MAFWFALLPVLSAIRKMNEENIVLNISAQKFASIINEIDVNARLHDDRKVDELTTKLWEAMSINDRNQALINACKD